jgi:hypothetical protein
MKKCFPNGANYQQKKKITLKKHLFFQKRKAPPHHQKKRTKTLRKSKLEISNLIDISTPYFFYTSKGKPRSSTRKQTEIHSSQPPSLTSSISPPSLSPSRSLTSTHRGAYSHASKETLTHRIEKLSVTPSIQTIAEILSQYVSNDSSDEVEIDLVNLPDEALWKIHDFVESVWDPALDHPEGNTTAAAATNIPGNLPDSSSSSSSSSQHSNSTTTTRINEEASNLSPKIEDLETTPAAKAVEGEQHEEEAAAVVINGVEAKVEGGRPGESVLPV